MARRFNTVGPCQREQHYILEPKERLPEIPLLVQEGKYFWLHGPRQAGKTTAMSLLAQDLTAKGKYAAVLVSAAAASVDAYEEVAAEDAFLYELRAAAQQLPEDLRPPTWDYEVAGQRIRAALSAWAIACPRPLVIFIDDIETLDDRPLMSLLRQLWGGFQQRGQGFPVSIGLISVRQVNDWSLPWGRRTSRQEWLTPGSLFHQMEAASLELGAFTVEDVANLYQKHTTDNGQLFTLEAVDRAFELTQGQPWLVNVLAQQLIATADGQIDSHHVDAAKSKLLQPQRTHIDHLSSRLWESQVKTTLQPVLMGEVLIDSAAQDVVNVINLGLCRVDAYGGVVVANPLYEAMILRHLSAVTFASLASVVLQTPAWMNPNGTLNVRAVLETLTTVWQRRGDALMGSVAYRAIAPYLAIDAFFRRVASAHGALETVYELPQNRVTLTWRTDAVVVVIGVRVWRDRAPDPIAAGLSHLGQALTDLPTAQGWLVLVDQRSERRPDHKRTTLETGHTTSGKVVSIMRG
ncbi:MAG: ATP-binding protein [Merismopedia sp. SIO2A8]|nr:ATP-binding protein [Merismopedia sp. SIO2A8]